MDWRRLEVDGVEELLGRGVYYGAGRSEALQCSNDDVVVVGAGNSAGQAAMYLADAGARVTMIVRGVGAGGVDVRLSRRPHRRALRIERAAAQQRDRGLRRGRPPGGASPSPTTAARRRISPSPRCSSASAACREPAGRRQEHVRTDAARLHPHRRRTARARRAAGRLDAGPRPARRSRPAARACSRPATCGPARPSGWPARPATAPAAVAQAHQRLAELAG